MTIIAAAWVSYSKGSDLYKKRNNSYRKEKKRFRRERTEGEYEN